MGDGFYRSKDPTNSIIQSTEGESYKGKQHKNIKKTENTQTHKIVYK